MRPTEVNPLQSPTVLIPSGKEHYVKVFTLARTDTTASVKSVLPADATIVDIKLFGPASNAATSATVSVGSTATANEFLNAQDVKTAGGMIRPTTALQNIFNLQPLPLGPDIQLYAKYAETGTASTAGGPWYVYVEYVR